jgi:hypothetical protein
MDSKLSNMIFPLIISFTMFISACFTDSDKKSEPVFQQQPISIQPKQNHAKVIHVFVALCDNINQGIVKVPAKIGNGQDPANNLYWGAAYGVKSYFKKQTDWHLIKSYKKSETVLERCLFKHRTQNVYLIADAYDGGYIKQATIDFLKSCAGILNDYIIDGKDSVFCGGNADLITFTGHDGLMDFTINQQFVKANDKKRESIILACISKKYFQAHLKSSGAEPLLWSTGLMSAEAYTLKAAIDGWMKKESSVQIRERAAAAYHQYQKCGMKGARNLLVTGW